MLKILGLDGTVKHSQKMAEQLLNDNFISPEQALDQVLINPESALNKP